jgi:hypothetical protein
VHEPDPQHIHHQQCECCRPFRSCPLALSQHPRPRVKPGLCERALDTEYYGPTYAGMSGAFNVMAVESVDLATFGPASADVEWFHQTTKTKVAVIATARMVRIGVPL